MQPRWIRADELRSSAREQTFRAFEAQWGSGGLLSHRTRSGLLQTAWSKVGRVMIRRTHDLLDKVSVSSKPSMPALSDRTLSEEDWANLDVEGQLWRPLALGPGAQDGEWAIVGRRASADIVINDYTVSTQHARVRLLDRGERLAVTDLDSTNGTEVDGLILSHDEAAETASRGIVVFGRQEFLFVPARDLYSLLLEGQAITAASESPV